MIPPNTVYVGRRPLGFCQGQRVYDYEDYETTAFLHSGPVLAVMLY